MKSPTLVDHAEGEEKATAKAPIKVCMYVLRAARNDVRLLRAASALVDAGFSVTIVDVVTERTRPHEEHDHGMRVKHVIMPTWYTARSFEPWFFLKVVQTLIFSIFQLLQTKADVYHAGDLTALPASYIAACLCRKPLIFDIYDLQFPVPETGIGFWRRMGRFITWMHTLILPRCAGVIATSPLHAQEIRDRFYIREVSLLRNILPYQSVGKSDRLRQFLGLGPNVRIVLYQGSIQPNRQLDRLIHAAPFLQEDIVIVMMGKSAGETQTRLEALIAAERVTDRVKIIPPVPYEELLNWTASADIGLIIYSAAYSLNVQMCLPNKLFEFLMAGLPVLSSQLDAVADVIKTHDVGQIVSSLTPEDIGAAINSMLADGDALARMRRNALVIAKQELNWEKESRQLIDLYHDILAR